MCSIKCRNANAKLLNHKIGRLWRACDCRKRNEFFSLSRNENFERNCMRGQNNIRAFCYYTPYRGKYIHMIMAYCTIFGDLLQVFNILNVTG